MTWLWNLIGLPSISAVAIYLGIGAALAGGGFYEGWHEKSLRDDADLVDAQAKVIAGIKQAEIITYNVSLEAAAKIDEIHTITQTIIQKVPVYVSKKSDAACVVPRGFVLLHNEAASGVSTVPDTSGQFNDAASGVELSAVASTVAGNYGSCRVEIERVTALQKWINEQAGR